MISCARKIMPVFKIFISCCYFGIFSVNAILPKMTPDHYRVHLLKVIGFMAGPDLENYYRCFLSTCEYIHTYDYCNGIVVILDYSETDILDVAKALDLIEVQQIIKILVEGFGLRLKGIHLISPSTLINIMVTFFKQAASKKLSERVFAHKTIESMYELLSQDILPLDYGGKDKNLKDLHNDLMDALITEEFTHHLTTMRGARTDEYFRQKDKFNNEFMGMPGTFRSLCLD